MYRNMGLRFWQRQYSASSHQSGHEPRVSPKPVGWHWRVWQQPPFGPRCGCFHFGRRTPGLRMSSRARASRRMNTHGLQAASEPPPGTIKWGKRRSRPAAVATAMRSHCWYQPRCHDATAAGATCAIAMHRRFVYKLDRKTTHAHAHYYSRIYSNIAATQP